MTPILTPNPASDQSRNRRLAVHMVSALALACFVALLYYPLLFTNRVLASGDILLYFYPYRDYAAAALREGRIPLWNPYIFNGVPFLANPQAAVLYPLHWPLSWLPVTKQIYWSAALHTWLLGYGGYRLARQQQLGTWAAFTVAIGLAGSGFYGGLIGHINQMNAAAWLPWAFLVVEGASNRWHHASRITHHTSRIMHHSLTIAQFALLVALMILAGHTQTAYINLFGIGLWIVGQALWHLPDWRLSITNIRTLLRNLWPPLLVYGAGSAVALLLCAAQLLPTLELSALGLRSGGLSYGEVSSFSLRPTQLLWTLLPTYGRLDLGPIFGAGYTEFVGYVGLVGLILAVIGGWRGRGAARTMGLFFAALGLFLALGRWNPAYYLLYKLVPGFDLFRVPARWLMLYTMGMALLAGAGLEQLTHYGLRFTQRLALARLPWQPLVVTLLLAIDLLGAAQALPHAHPTAPQAVYGMRTAPAHLLTDPQRTALDPAAMGRFLGMSTITYDPGDMADWQQVLRSGNPPALDQAAFNDFVIGIKIQELLVPNLPLLWRVPAVDGFDGGVLPLQRYNKFLTLFVPADQLVPDGRLREQIKSIPNSDALGLFNVQYVITDKVRDLWFDNVYYDRQIGTRLAPETPLVTIEVPHRFEATHVDLIGFVDGGSSLLHESNTIATLSVHSTVDTGSDLAIRAGTDLAGPTLDDPVALEHGATVAFRDVEQGLQEYRVRLPLPRPTTPTGLTIRQIAGAPPLVIQAVTLYDERTQMFTPLLPSDQGHFRLVHSGDVKIYENLDVRPRAYLVHNVLTAGTADEALDRIRESDLIPRGEAAVIEVDQEMKGVTHWLATNPQATDSAQILDYAPEAVIIKVTTAEDALLVLSDSYFPGWQATIDDLPTAIYPANVLFRGVPVPAGEHVVAMHYTPQRWRLGGWLSALGIVLWLGLILMGRGKLRSQHFQALL